MKTFKKSKAFKTIASSKGSGVIGLYGMEAQSTIYRLLIPDFTVGNLEIENLITETSINDNSRLGSQLLEYGTLTLDYKNKSFYLTPFQDKVAYAQSDWEIQPTYDGEKLLVGRVWSKTLKGVSSGNEIVEINGRRVETASICNILLNSPLEGLQKAELTIKNSKGELIKVGIEKSKLTP